MRAEMEYHREVQARPEDAKKDSDLSGATNDMYRYFKGVFRHLAIRRERPSLAKTSSGSARGKGTPSAVEKEELVDSNDL